MSGENTYEVAVNGEPYRSNLTFQEASVIAQVEKGKGHRVTIRTQPLDRKRSRVPGAHAAGD